MQLGRMRFAPTGTHTKKRKKFPLFLQLFSSFSKVETIYIYKDNETTRQRVTCRLVDLWTRRLVVNNNQINIKVL